jgi:CheY-like chemotaxis protein
MASGMQVLIADDEPSVLSLYKLDLESAGHHVVCTEDGEQCLAAYLGALSNNKVFDLVILDYRIPGKNGLEVAREITNIVPKQQILMTTAYSGITNLKNKPENMTILTKPFEPQKLLDAVAYVCQRVRLD